MECYKCKGTGFLSCFSYYADGVCFACKGTGVLPEAKKKNVGYSRAFINEFLQKGFFPEDQSQMIRVECISLQGHPTAEHWILKDKTAFYIGQPVCRASTWYKIPVESFADFLMHYNKANKSKAFVQANAATSEFPH